MCPEEDDSIIVETFVFDVKNFVVGIEETTMNNSQLRESLKDNPQ